MPPHINLIIYAVTQVNPDMGWSTWLAALGGFAPAAAFGYIVYRDLNRRLDRTMASLDASVTSASDTRDAMRANAAALASLREAVTALERRIDERRT